MDKLFINSDFIEGYIPKLSEDGIFSSTPSEHYEYMNNMISTNFTGINNILELCACSGVDTIKLAKGFESNDNIKVHSYEINKDNFKVLKDNITNSVYSDNITLHNESFVNAIDLDQNFDLIYYDPPWGKRYDINNKRVYEPAVIDESDFVDAIIPIVKKFKPSVIVIKVPEYLLDSNDDIISIDKYIDIRGYELLNNLKIITKKNKVLYNYLLYTPISYKNSYIRINSLRMNPFNYRLL